MLIENFTIETVEVNGIPVQTFKKRYRNLRQMFKAPQRIFFVPDLPRNPGGKVIKGKLIEQFQTT